MRSSSNSRSRDTRSGRTRQLRAGVIALSIAAILGLPADASHADPVVRTGTIAIGGGLVSHAVSIDFQDGLSRSGFVEISFSGNFDDQRSRLEVANWPDLQLADAGEAVPGVYSLRGGTGAGTAVDVVPVATLVLPEGESFSYSGIISRNGRNFSVVPEPAASELAAAALCTLAALRRRLW